ncbi:trafficking protein particle complex subunit 3 [Neocloeon triangulifer]|uniref:trafficking protein particle complex subunit 3 n=1 Tax=Neocloeon triangulifer TaxID=2078957 RepID=UPI00286EDC1C|nr:trafficking protein particle complex subunit 3 [Neocloeon triangulifer]
MSRQASRLDAKKVNSELFTLTYGALVTQLIRDLDTVEEVNKQLERMGYNIGVRLIEDFLARSGSGRCFDFRDTAEKIQLATRMFLGVNPIISNWSPSSDEFSLILDSNPITDFVELPDSHLGLKYSNMLTGVIRGACEMVQLEVACWFVQDQLKGDSSTEIRVKLLRKLEDSVPAGED